MRTDIFLHPKVFLALRKDGKSKGSGLRCRRLGPGRYRFVRQDRKPTHIEEAENVDERD